MSRVIKDSIPIKHLKTQPDTGYFLLSIDTELAWGYFDHFNPALFSAEGERKITRRLLDILDEFHITATWAVVGGMFNRRFEDGQFEPVVRAWEEHYSEYIHMLKTNSALLYGGDIVDMLMTRGARHEIAFHGYTHRPFNPEKMSLETARYEIEQWLRVASHRGIEAKSFVFPRNKIGYLPLVKEYGFKCYREDILYPWYYFIPLMGKGFRRFAYPLSMITIPQVYGYQVAENGLVCLPSSQWLFGFDRQSELKLDAMDKPFLRLKTLVQGVKKAARQKKIIHVFIHPYEFQTDADFEKLRFVLQAVAEQVQAGKMKTITMGNLTQKILTYV